MIKRLTRNHDRAGFDCGVDSLNRFLREIARQEADRDLGVTFAATSDDDPRTILGYYTLVMGSVAGAIWPAGSAASRKVIPVALLGRLAVDKRCQGQGLGERLLFHALYQVQQTAETVAAHAVIVDAIDERARSFYMRYGFVSLLDDPLHLYLPLKTIRALNLKPAP